MSLQHQNCSADCMVPCCVALAAAVTCASVALAETGVEMLDLPIACSVVRKCCVCIRPTRVSCS